MIAWITGAFGVGHHRTIFAGQLAAHTGSVTLPTLVASGMLVIGAALTGFVKQKER